MTLPARDARATSPRRAGRAIAPGPTVEAVVGRRGRGLTAAHLAYLNVRPYSGGLEVWLSAGLPIEIANADGVDHGVAAGDPIPTRLIVLPDGPYEVAGPLEISRPNDAPIPAPDPVYLCRCGRSASKPFCDGSHAHTGWTEHA